MLELGPLSFAAPWVLAALVAVPAIIWLLRVTPPSPRRVPFPALRLLLSLPRTREEPVRTPLWLLLLRAALALFIILALAGPVFRTGGAKTEARPLLLAIDDGWASADDWPRRKRVMIALIEEAARDDVPVALITTAERVDQSGPPERVPASDARARIEALDPVPWPVDRDAAARRLNAATWNGSSRVVWLTDGLDAPGTDALRAALSKRGALTITEPHLGHPPLVLLAPRAQGDGLVLTLRRPANAPGLDGILHARNASGQSVAETPFTFAPGKSETVARFDGPQGLMNDVARIEIEGRRSAAAVALIDESHKKHSVGLIAGGASEENQPLLSDLFYLDRALSPFATVTRGSIEALATSERSIIMLADVGRILGQEHERLARWIEEGGTLVRFAGPRLAAPGGSLGDDLVPVPLRQGGRTLGGALSWDTPAPLGTFDADGPFAGLAASTDVHVRRQVLAEPVPDLASRTWARLADGTPLVTAAPRGAGRIVLIHVTANTDWSDLPLSGAYVEMLRRLVALAKAPNSAAPLPAATPELLTPLRTLDAYGALATPPPGSEAITTGAFDTTATGPHHPPGLYGREDNARAFNLGRPGMMPTPLKLDGTVGDEALSALSTRDLKPWMLSAALALALADALAALLLTGGLAALRRNATRLASGAGVVLFAILLLGPSPARADDRTTIEAVHALRLAYVRTGDAETDQVSRAGLEGLSRTLGERTAVEPDKPFGIDLDTDELAFFPLLYWQVPPNQPALSPQAVQRLDRFMKTGGTLVIDTADADRNFGDGNAGPGEARLRTLLADLDLPPLEPVPHDHVLTKSFYLLQEFPGRLANGRVWIEAARGGADHDGVASLIVGSNGWAAAWARDANGNALYPVTPGGEIQRERALRFGINLVMYALTGNYKADQVHVPALLERLGQ